MLIVSFLFGILLCLNSSEKFILHYAVWTLYLFFLVSICVQKENKTLLDFEFRKKNVSVVLLLVQDCSKQELKHMAVSVGLET